MTIFKDAPIVAVHWLGGCRRNVLNRLLDCRGSGPVAWHHVMNGWGPLSQAPPGARDRRGSAGSTQIPYCCRTDPIHRGPDGQPGARHEWSDPSASLGASLHSRGLCGPRIGSSAHDRARQRQDDVVCSDRRSCLIWMIGNAGACGTLRTRYRSATSGTARPSRPSARIPRRPTA